MQRDDGPSARITVLTHQHDAATAKPYLAVPRIADGARAHRLSLRRFSRNRVPGTGLPL